jgi:dipeptidyl aminopeptidase/acylaminoacyl peptidase
MPFSFILQELINPINFMKRTITALLLFAASAVHAQQASTLTVEKIMRDQKWIGTAPSNYRWADDSKSLYFEWNPQNKPKEQLFRIQVGKIKPELSADSTTEKVIGPVFTYNQNGSLGVAEQEGDIYLINVKTKKRTRLTNTLERESNPGFLMNGAIYFLKSGNFFTLDPNSQSLAQLTNFMPGTKPVVNKPAPSAQETWLKNQQTSLFDVLKDNTASAGRRPGPATNKQTIKPIYLDNKAINGLSLSPDGRFVTYQLVTTAKGNTNTIIPNFVTKSGYTEDINGRTKVGENAANYEFFIYDKQRDSAYQVSVSNLTGIKDLPDYVKDYPKQLEERSKKNEDRKVRFTPVIWNANASAAVLTAKALDNKDLWILKLDAAIGSFSVVDRQRDEAWIAGPGISSYFANMDFIDQNKIYFQSEASGYSHLYVADLNAGSKKQLTSGKWEVQTLTLSKDKKTFYFTGNMEHPGVTHFYSMPVGGGKPTQITSMKGGNQITLSPDEKWIAINYSYMDKPWELYLQPNKPGAKALQITESRSDEFKSYAWRKPELVAYKNRHGDDVYARIYPAKNGGKNSPAVVFVHGAGYLQNVHYWWSQYSREYMFHNLLADNGYTVIDIDYTGSSGYGRNHRTGIYRHMGGKDLTDQVDGVKLLVDKYGVDPKRVGIYGGSYGGFITLMALFNEPDVFKSGAGLRSVTDWAHYNQGYTANILNEPFNDEIAYQRSSPINFAKGLKGNLLMCHGMVDVNVHFQDIVRLSQKLIELGKDNWELAVYPVEDHGFTTPSSWTDEYKRIFKLFETTLKNP